MADEDSTSDEALLSQDIDRFRHSVGRFVLQFSDVEAMLQTVVWHFAGIAPPIAQAVFPGIRIEAAMTYMNRIADARKWNDAEKSGFEYIFLQLGMINKLRNDILHYGATLDLDNVGHWLVTNELVAHIPEKIRTTRISATTLDDASSDLHKIGSHLIILTWGDSMPPEAHNFYEAELARAWQYKPQQQAGDPSTTRKTPQERQRRQRPSRGKPPDR